MAFTCCGKDRQKIIEWGDGSKEIKYYPDIRDTLTYLREYYYPNDQLGTIGKMVNGKMDSTWVWYYPNGSIKDLAFFENGLYVREKRHWYSDGNLKSIEYIEKPCVNNCCDGYVIHYDTLFVLSQKFKIRNGLRQDTFYQYWPNGNIYILAMLKDDKLNGFYKEYYSNSKKRLIGQFINDKEEGTWETYDSTGILISTEKYSNGVRVY